MSPLALASLAALLEARSVRVIPGSREPGRRVLLGRGCQALRSGPVDVAVLAGPAALPSSRAVVLLEGARARRPRRRGNPDQLVLGAGSGVWSHRLRAGIAASQTPDPRGWLLLAQGCGVAEQVLGAAARRRLPVRAALGSGVGGPQLLRLARLALQLPGPPRLLLALHRPPSFADLLELGLAHAPAVLLLTFSAEHLSAPPGPAGAPFPSSSDLAGSLGLPVTRSPEELVNAAALLEAGLRPRHRLIVGLATRTDEAALLADALGRAGLAGSARGALPGAAVVRTRQPAARALRGTDAMVVIGEPGSRPLLFPAGSRRGLEADREMLLAVAALLQPADRPALTGPGRAPARPGETARRAALLLDGWPAALTEVEAKAVLALYGLAAPGERLTSSASAASQAAGELGFPVAVKAVGPGLHERSAQGCLRLGVHGAASVRQAFRDVLDGCAHLQPSPALSGVLVSRMVPLPFALDFTLLYPEAAPPVLLACRRRLGDPVLALPCPVGAAPAAWAAGRLISPGQPLPVRARLVEWVRRLGELASDLQGRLRWLRLDTVAPPTVESPPLVIDAFALQTASLRDPLGLREGGPLE